MRWTRVLLLICITGLLAAGCKQYDTPQPDLMKKKAESSEEDPVKKEAEDQGEEPVVLPRKYCLEEVNLPAVQDQAGTNSCWAYASLSALEASKTNFTGKSFSAEHLINENPFSKDFKEGGSYVVPMAYLLSWKGPTFEREEEVSEREEAVSESESLVLETEDLFLEDEEPAVHVQEIRCIEPGDYEAIKRFIYCYGGVESGLYMDFDEYVQESDCYNKETNSYCYLGTEISNHDVVIVGWDDDFPAENFSGDVTENGAFLCQNSWGESFGDRGIFYVSYEDVNIGGYGIAYTRIENNRNYDLLYQTDLCGFTAQIGYGAENCWFGNVYEAEEEILLRAAGFYATGKNTAYDIYLVEDFEEKKSFRSKKHICSGFLKDAGFYTIDFPEEEKIAADDKFAILIKINTEKAEYPVAVECRVDGLSEDADISDGQGYLSCQGIVWEHIEETKEYNICLKVYADRFE